VARTWWKQSSRKIAKKSPQSAQFLAGRNWAQLRLEELERRECPSITATGVALTGPVINEGVAATETLAGTIVGRSVGDILLAINWGDGSAVQNVILAAGAQSFSVPHTYNFADDNPTGTASDNFNVTYTLTDYGPSVLAGPNTAGYRAYDVPAPNLPLTASISGTTTLAPTSVDDGTASIDLGTNTFRYYGTTYTGTGQLFVCTNGFISFLTANTANTNTALASGPTQAAIAPLWDDLHLRSGSILSRFVDIDGNGINDYLIVDWHGIGFFSGGTASGDLTFQAWLQLNSGTTNGDILFNYTDNT